LRVLTDDALAEALRRNARENVEKNYSWSRISEQTLEVYQRVYHEYRGQEVWRPKR
jgi:glycosyltransferase involved in cell wall biosynthesis